MSTIIDFFHNQPKNDINTKIFGVSFPGIAGSYSGTRLYDSVGKQFTPSYGTTPGIDEFITEKNSPFDICEVMLDSSSGTIVEVGTEKDSNWNDLLITNRYDSATNPTPLYNHMVRFPRFYYKRPSKWEFQVSGYQHPGFLPSPMHYRAGKMYDYCYISKYIMTGSFSFQAGLTPADDPSPPWKYTYEVARSQLLSKGMHLMDYMAYSGIMILMMIKYATLDISHLIGIGRSDSTLLPNGQTLNISGKDGYTLSNPNTSGGTTLTLGIEGFYNGSEWILLDGAFESNGGLYVNPDIESITSNPTSDTGFIHINGEIPRLGQWMFPTDIFYDPNYPMIVMPCGSESNKDNSTIPNLMYYGDRSFYTIWIGNAYDANNGGPFGHHMNAYTWSMKDTRSSFLGMAFR